MSNPYYNYSGNFLAGGLARAEAVASEFTNVQAGFNSLSYQGTDSGSTNAYVVTTPYSPQTSYVDGNNVEFKAANGNTGASTINVNGIGSASLLRGTGSALQGGDIIAGVWYLLTYSSTFGGWLVSSPASYTSFSGTISSAPPTHKVGLTAAAGASTAAAPIDATYAIDQSIAPTWSGLHTFTDGLTVSSGTTTVQALTSATGITVTTGGLTVSAGTTTVQALTSATGITVTTGGLTVSAGTTTVQALLVNGAANQYAGQFIASTTSGQSYGLQVNAGSNSADTALYVANRAGSNGYFRIAGDGSGFLGPSASTGISWSAAGAVTIAAPSAATALSVTAVAGNYNAVFTSPNTTGQSFGPIIKAGTNSSDTALYISNAASTKVYAQITGDGSGSLGNNGSANTIAWSAAGDVTIAAPTSGSALTVTGAASSYALGITGADSSGNSYGLAVSAGYTSADVSVRFTNQAGISYQVIKGDGSGVLGYNGSANTISWNAAGAVSVATPSSASNPTLSASGASGAYGAVFGGTGSAGTQQALQAFVTTTNAADVIFSGIVSGSHSVAAIYGDGHFYIGYNGTMGSLQGSAAGGVTITTPASGTAFTINAANGYNGLLAYGGSTSGQSYGATISGGTTSADFGLRVVNNAGHNLLLTAGDGSGVLGYNGSANTISWNAAGAVSIAAPSSGTALTVNGAANQYSESVIGSATSGQSFGLYVAAGSTSGDNALNVLNNAGHVLLETFGDGHGVLGYNGTTNTISWTAAGAVTIATPSSGAALTIAGGGITISAGGLTVTAGGITVNGGAATFNAGLAATGATITGAGSSAPLTIVNGGTSSECLNIGNQYYGTGSQTATFSATNKPGSGTTGPTQWLYIQLNGTNYLIPCWQ